MMLRPGSIVMLQNNRLGCAVEAPLGAGGQGEVYRVRVSEPEGERKYALKWYFPHWASREQWETLQALVRMDSPSHHFLWPIDMAVGDADGFGYLMPLRGDDFRGITELMRATVNPTFRVLANVAYQLSDGFLQLHAAGLCYRDISFGNVFFNPDSGEVLICDNDNVGVDGRAARGVKGTDRFMAPEVVRGEALPSSVTDLYSLSVLLFYLCMVHHPLEGRLEVSGGITDPSRDHYLFGDHPVFVWDPVDTSNRPVPGVHDNGIAYWAVYPQFLRDLFVRAFTDGLKHPQNGRVRESEWRSAAARLKDAIYYCPVCTHENFWDEARTETRCWRCRASVTPPARLITRRGAVLLNNDTRLFPHHLSGVRGDYSAPEAAVVRHPSRPGVWGLRNLSQRTWTTTDRGQLPVPVPPGRSCTLNPGTVIDFGGTTGTVEQ